MPDIGDGGMEAANHLAMYVPMQQSCMISTCTPEPKYNEKNDEMATVGKERPFKVCFQFKHALNSGENVDYTKTEYY